MPKDWDKYAKQGVFFALFVTLLFFTMNENRAREAEYQKVIQQQSETNSKFADLIKVDLTEIKAVLRDGGDALGRGKSFAEKLGEVSPAN